MNKLHPTILFILLSILTLNAERVGFNSKLFEQFRILYIDDFNEKHFWGRFGPNKGNIRVVGGKLVVSPLPKREDKLIETHILKIPPKYVLYMKFKVKSKEPDAGVGLQLGENKLHLSSKTGVFQLFSRVGNKTFANPEVKDFVANKWISMIIEYQEGEILLNINGVEKQYKDPALSMDGAKSLVFKNSKADSLVFEYVRLFEARK